MLKTKLLSGSVILLLLWALCVFGLNVGGVVHSMLILSIIGIAVHVYFFNHFQLKH
jgi:hypothetical protein